MRGGRYRLVEVVRVLSEEANRVSGVAVVLMIILIVAEVVLRKFFDRSTTLCDEYTGYFQAAVVFLSLAQCFKDNLHISVDLILRRLPNPLRRWIEVINHLVALFFVAILLWAGGQMAWESFLFGSTSYGPSNTPLFIPQLVVVIGLAIFAIQILCSFLLTIVKQSEAS